MDINNNDKTNDYTAKDSFNYERFENYFKKFWLLYPTQHESIREESKQLFKKLYLADHHELVISILRTQVMVYKYKKAKRIWAPYWLSMINWLKQQKWLEEIKIPLTVKHGLEEEELIKNQISDKEKYDREEKETRIAGDEFIREWYMRKNNKKYGSCPLDIINFGHHNHKERIKQLREMK